MQLAARLAIVSAFFCDSARWSTPFARRARTCRSLSISTPKMPSDAFSGLVAGIEEIRHLQAANPTPIGGIAARSNVVRAINRSSVVLLTSHLERYIRA